MKLLSNSTEEYLKSSKYIDWENSDVLKLADSVFEKNQIEIEFVKGILRYLHD